MKNQSLHNSNKVRLMMLWLELRLLLYRLFQFITNYYTTLKTRSSSLRAMVIKINYLKIYKFCKFRHFCRRKFHLIAIIFFKKFQKARNWIWSGAWRELDFFPHHGRVYLLCARLERVQNVTPPQFLWRIVKQEE